MAQIRGTDTGPERIVRAGLHRAGFRFRLHRRDLPGRPDVVLPKYTAVIFVHGCFWHSHSGCSNATIPGTRTRFWSQKLDETRAEMAAWKAVTVGAAFPPGT